MPKDHVIRITLVEAVANLTCSIILGISVGLIAALMIAALLMTVAELPFLLIVPWGVVMGMIAMSYATIVTGTLIGTRQIRYKSISSILRGI